MIAVMNCTFCCMPFERSATFFSDQSPSPKRSSHSPARRPASASGRPRSAPRNTIKSHLHPLIKPALFRQVTDGFARFIGYRLAEDANRAFVWNQNIHHHSDGGGLTGAVWPK